MKHSTAELSEIAYSLFPRGIASGDPEYLGTAQYRHQQEAHARASGEYKVWSRILARTEARFPEERFPGVSVENRSLFLQSPTIEAFDRCFSGALRLPVRGPSEKQHRLGFLVSFVVPYYVVYSGRLAQLDAPRMGMDVENVVSFEMSPDEEPFARGLVEEIEATYPGHVGMTPEVGRVILPDVNVLHDFGEVTLFDCLFSSNW